MIEPGENPEVAAEGTGSGTTPDGDGSSGDKAGGTRSPVAGD
jgi:hypothetical protein